MLAKIVCQAALEAGDSFGVFEEDGDWHHLPPLTFVAEDNGADLFLGDLGGKHVTVLTCRTWIPPHPMDGPGIEDDPELLFDFPQCALDRRLIALPPAAGQVPEAGVGDAGLVISLIGHQFVAMDQDDLAPSKVMA